MRLLIQRKEWDKHYYYARQKFLQKKIKNETLEQESQKVKMVLDELKDFKILPHTKFPMEKFLHYRKLIHSKDFTVYWTAINPPMEQLLYAISSILQPKNILGVGIFTGNPVAWSLGPAIEGEYTIDKMVAVEIDKDHASVCRKNFEKVIEKNQQEKINIQKNVEVLDKDGFKIIEHYPDESIDLLYLDANGFDPETQKNSKNINTSLLKAAYPKIKKGGYAICHNVYQPSFRKKAPGYFTFTEEEDKWERTATCGIDEMGIEISKKQTTNKR